ncbi:MAG TPA: TlpA disulfide reductase family protein [Longimicrobiales bacterium]|nr:TlpA disulfide reductase family protein [Longimicrobiales bacterium]
MRRVRPNLLVAALVVALGIPAGGVAQSGQSGIGLPLGTQAPPAMVEDLDGNPVELLDLVGGRPALIEFWASWCENCEALQPQLDEIQARHGDEIAVVAVAVAVAQSVRRVRRHLEDHDPGYPFLWDASGAAVRAYKAPTTSVVVILDAGGKVVYTGSGGGQDLTGAVARVLGKGPARELPRRALVLGPASVPGPMGPRAPASPSR